jgi:hypothetical protein
MTSTYIIDRQLPERAYLKFYFPNPIEGKDHFVVELPFYENPKIKESKKARLQKYNLLSRSSNLYSYLGANSREFSVDFSITLPHILDEARSLTISQYDSSLENPEFEREKFKSPVTTPNPNPSVAASFATRYYKGSDTLRDSVRQVLGLGGFTTVEEEYIRSLAGLTTFETEQNQTELNQAARFSETATSPATVTANVPPSETQEIDDPAFVSKMKAIDVVLYWVNIIRSSVVNNSENPIYGPPIIRLNHGLLFQNIPCVCRNYNISVDERAGYDLQTLLPRKLDIQLRLEESRTGNFGKFNQNRAIERDNLAGWEAVLSDPFTMDPGDNIN